MFRLIACSMFQRFTCLMYVYTNTRTQIPLDTYKQVYHQTEIRLNYAKCYNLREILLICVRCCSNMSNILFNQATFHAIGQDPFLAWPVSINRLFWGIEILKMSQSWFFFCATYTKIAISKKWQSNWWLMAREDQYIKYCRMQSLTNLCYSNNSYFKEI